MREGREGALDSRLRGNDGVAFLRGNDGSFIGCITGLYHDVLQGWVLDGEAPDLRVTVEVYVDGAFALLARADQRQARHDQGDGFHGFAARLRPEWLRGAGVVAVRVANGGPWLEGTLRLPVSASPKEPAPAASQVWHTGGLRLRGWAWDTDAPERHVMLTVREHGTVIAQVPADQVHPALMAQASADHGFEIDLPWQLADGRPHVLHVETDGGQPVTGSPVTMLATHEGLEALLLKHWPGAGQEPGLALLRQLAADQDRRLPRTAGFASYPQWFAARPVAVVPAAEGQQPVGVLLFGEGAEEASRASLAGQAVPTVVARASGDGVAQALRALLDRGVGAVLPLQVGDRLAPEALALLAPQVAPGASAWAFADCDSDGPDGERAHPWFKPQWDVDLFLGADVFTPGAIVGAATARSALAELERQSDPAPADIHGFMAAVAAVTSAGQVARITRVLYHRRHGAPTSPALAPASPARARAMNWLANRLARGATVRSHSAFPGLLVTRWPEPAADAWPTVSVIVSTRDQLGLLRDCVQGVLEGTDYPGLELIVVDNESVVPETLHYLDQLRQRGVRVLRYPHPFNYSAINNTAVQHASGELVCLLNNDVAMRDAGWLKAMVVQALRPGVGIVGAKLLWPNDMVQHGGVVLGINGLAAHTGNAWHAADAGYLGFNQVARRQSAVTAACLLMRKALYQQVGGLDATAFPVAFNDVDLCLRVGRAGHAVVWEPLAQLTHRESASRGKDRLPEQAGRALREQMHLRERLAQGPADDPYYHPHLNHDWLDGPYAGLSMRA